MGIVRPKFGVWWLVKQMQASNCVSWNSDSSRTFSRCQFLKKVTTWFITTWWIHVTTFGLSGFNFWSRKSFHVACHASCHQETKLFIIHLYDFLLPFFVCVGKEHFDVAVAVVSCGWSEIVKIKQMSTCQSQFCAGKEIPCQFVLHFWTRHVCQ